MTGMRSTVCAIAVALLVLLASGADLPQCDGGFDVSPVSRTLLYTGSNQDVRKERGSAGGGDGLGAFRCFRGQHWEDLYVFQHLLHGVGGGFFIELGGLDGYSFSVTYFFEIFQKWKGLLIEASPQNHQLFERRSRKMKAWRRRTVPYVHAAVCGEPRPLTYVSKEGTGAGILEFMAPDQQQRNRRMCTNRTSLDGVEGIGKGDCWLTPIKCVNLASLLSERRVSHVDLFVLDVEGAEYEVLQNVDLDDVPVRYFLIELDGTAPAKDAKVRCKLRQAGFEPMGRLDLNELWVNRRFPHDKVKSTYTPVAPDNWRRCFRGSHVDFLKPTPWFNTTTAASGADSGLLLTESAGSVTDEPLVDAPPPQVSAASHVRIISDANDADAAAAAASFLDPFVVIVLGMLGFTGYAMYRRRLRR